MSRLAFAAAVLALASSACVKTADYEVDRIATEVIPGRLDASWFSREIHGKDGKIVAEELVYCPVVSGAPTVCRTAIVWKKSTSVLLDK